MSSGAEYLSCCIFHPKVLCPVDPGRQRPWQPPVKWILSQVRPCPKSTSLRDQDFLGNNSSPGHQMETDAEKDLLSLLSFAPGCQPSFSPTPLCLGPEQSGRRGQIGRADAIKGPQSIRGQSMVMPLSNRWHIRMKNTCGCSSNHCKA